MLGSSSLVAQLLSGAYMSSKRRPTPCSSLPVSPSYDAATVHGLDAVSLAGWHREVHALQFLASASSCKLDVALALGWLSVYHS